MKIKLIIGCFIFFILLFLNNSVSAQITLPYYNNFDNSDTIGWSHYAISGVDDWVITKPSKTTFNSAYSLPYAWVTNKTGNFANNSNRALQTPSFNLSDTLGQLVLSFYHKTQIGTVSNFYVEYSLNNGASWFELTKINSPSINWQDNYGFPGYYYTSFHYSAARIKFLQGNPSVCFRFRFNCGFATGDGWEIDDFSIDKEYYNIMAVPGDTIKNLNQLFTQFPLKFNFQFNNQYDNNYTFTNKFYLSKDPIKDSSDIVLGTKTITCNKSVPDWTNTFNLPQGLHAGNYYILYDLDITNVLKTEDKSDNSSYTILHIDSLYNTNFTDDFESFLGNWNSAFPRGSTKWKQGTPNYFRMEKVHFGKNVFYTNSKTGTSLLESPYIDLSKKTNQSICFWYKQTNPSSNLELKIPINRSFKTTAPTYNPSIYINKPSNNNWYCYCNKLPASFDTICSTKFAVSASTMGIDAASNIDDYTLFAIDDMYIGECKPDASIDFREGCHYTQTGLVTDTVFYFLFNAGLNILPLTKSEFYWSTDSILDATDILIASVNEPVISDTTYIKRSFAYSKPMLNKGTYFIIYKLDATSAVNEMREYNNIGYLKVIQNTNETLPYFNDFETQTNNWNHYATVGNDDWVCSTPHKAYFNSSPLG